jgi:transcriptional regulator with XRE-family HTH domain
MSERLERIYKLLKNQKSRASYIRAKLVVLVPAQIRALRLKSKNPTMPRQIDLAREAELHQSRISMFETPGAANVTLETLAKIAAGLRVGVIVKFVPFHEMLHWENCFSPDAFDVTPRLEQDELFLNPSVDVEASYNSWFQDGNVAAWQHEPAFNSAGTERKPMVTVEDRNEMMAAAEAGNGGL